MYLSPVYTAAPAVADERVGTVFAVLDSLGIPYIRFEHDATATMEDCAAVGKALHGTICKNLFLCNRQQTAFYLLTSRSTQRISPRRSARPACPSPRRRRWRSCSTRTPAPPR